jgi:NAD(P) transhydrogenase
MLSGWRSRQLHGVDLSLRREATITDFMRHQKHVTESERQRLEERLALRGVTRFHGAASFVDAHTVRIVAEGGA